MATDLIKSADLRGVHLLGLGGAKLGAVREVFLDLRSGAVEYLIVEAAALLGGSGKFNPIPWAVVRYDHVAGAFQAELTKDDLKAAPSYDREQLANSSYGWDEQASRYFSAGSLPPGGQAEGLDRP